MPINKTPRLPGPKPPKKPKIVSGPKSTSKPKVTTAQIAKAAIKKAADKKNSKSTVAGGSKFKPPVGVGLKRKTVYSIAKSVANQMPKKSGAKTIRNTPMPKRKSSNMGKRMY